LLISTPNISVKIETIAELSVIQKLSVIRPFVNSFVQSLIHSFILSFIHYTLDAKENTEQLFTIKSDQYQRLFNIVPVFYLCYIIRLKSAEMNRFKFGRLATFLLVCCTGSITTSSSLWGHHASPCIYEDHLVTDKNWFGYLANITIMTTGRLTFEFYYPADKCCQNILFYSEDQIAIINARMNCWQKEYLLRPEEVCCNLYNHLLVITCYIHLL